MSVIASPLVLSSPQRRDAVVSTDGSALRNPSGPMGWGWIDHDTKEYDAGGAVNGTNQIGELTAILMCLRSYQECNHLTIESDSNYAIQCSTTWVKTWKKNGWKNSQKKRISNYALVRAIDNEMIKREQHNFTTCFQWVKGHAGNTFNDAADGLAHGYSSAIEEERSSSYLPIEAWKVLMEGPYMKGYTIPGEVLSAIEDESSATLF